MAVIKDMISSQKIQLLKAPFLVHFISTDHSEVIYDAKQNINPFLQIQGYTLVLSELISRRWLQKLTFLLPFLKIFIYLFIFFFSVSY